MAYNSHNGIIIKFKTHNDTLVSYIDSRTDKGKLVDLEISWKETGGVESIDLSINKDNNFILFEGLIVEIYANNNKIFIGYLVHIPEQDTSEDFIKLSFNGLSSQMENVTVSKTYTSKTFEYIFNDLATDFEYTDIQILNSKIEVPTSLIVDSISVEDTTLLSLVEDLVKYCNTNNDTDKYVYYIDNDRYLVIKNVNNSGAIINNLYEGYHYQNPSTEKDSTGIINKIYAYRTTIADASITEYVGSYSNSESIASYGQKTSKVLFSNYYSDTIIQTICNFILNENAYPRYTVSVENLAITEDIERGFYRTNNKPRYYKETLSLCEDLDIWDTSNINSSHITTSTQYVKTGRNSIQFEGTPGEYIELTVPYKVPFPVLFRAIGLFSDSSVDYEIEVIFQDDLSQEYRLEFSSNKSGWIDKELGEQSRSSLDNLIVTYDDDIDYNFSITYHSDTEFNLVSRSSVGVGIFNVNKIKILAISGSGTFYLDFLGVTAKSYKSRDLYIKEATVKNLDGALIADISFGKELPSLITEILEGEEQGKTTYNIFSK